VVYQTKMVQAKLGRSKEKSLWMCGVRRKTQVLTFIRTCTSSMYTSTYAQITKEFHCSRIVATLGLSLYIMGLGIGPMLLGPLSYVLNRRPRFVPLTPRQRVLWKTTNISGLFQLLLDLDHPLCRGAEYPDYVSSTIY
jgi:hypothetical protein